MRLYLRSDSGAATSNACSCFVNAVLPLICLRVRLHIQKQVRLFELLHVDGWSASRTDSNESSRVLCHA